MVSKYIHYYRRMKTEFCFLKPNILVKYCGEGVIEKSKEFVKDCFPTSKNHATIPCKGVLHNAIFLTKRCTVDLSYLQLVSLEFWAYLLFELNINL